ncbi:MAG: hypothetical protein NTY20_01190 [Candidatus Aenigmarchaeota archaeon]|nr:hypothetical protein [Candidatus Aenigmarchaeota archaeon]
MFELVERENEILGMLEKLAARGLDFAVIGGYGVSAYRHRFSVDADIVIRKEDAEKFENILKESGYRKTISRVLENTYSSEFVRYEKSQPNVNMDMLIGGIGVRQTGASFGFDFIFGNSGKKEIEGSERSVTCMVPIKELLIILKLHSGRLTDLRDVAALSFNLDIGFIKKHLFRGDAKILKGNMKKLESLLEKQEFQDSFKGVFMEKEYKINVPEIKKLANLSSQ